MIPVLYNYSEKEFVNQGLGALVDAMSCIVEEELNGIYELTMTYPITGEHFDLLENQRLILAMPSKGTRAQPFEIYSISKPLNGVVTVNAQHISYRLSYIPVVPFTCNGCAMALQMMKANSLEENPFTVWTDIANTTRKFSFDSPQSFRLCLGGTEGSLVDRFYGEYEFDRFDVRFWSKRGTVRETAQIIYGKNLKDLKQEDSFEYVVTGIYPYWKSQTTNGDDTTTTVVTLPEKVIYSKYADSYAYRRTVPYDFSQDFQEAPTVEALRERAKEYVQQSLSTTPSINMSISFASLADSEENKNLVEETLNLGDTLAVYFSKLGISTKARITKTTFNVLIEQYDSLTIGSKSSLSKTISSMEKRNKEIESNQITISQVKSSLDAQKTIMDGAAGGSVLTQYTNGKPSATIYTDTDDISTAKNALIMNKNGIAFSHNGVEGPYETAWTIDGRFSANFITSGEFDGSLIKGGTIIAGALDEEVTSSISNANLAASEAKNIADNAQNAASEATNTANSATESANNANAMSKEAYLQAQQAQLASQDAQKLASSAWQGANDLAQVFVADSTGAKVKEARNSNNYSHMQSSGMRIILNNSTRAVLGIQSHVDDLAVSGYLMFGSHRAEALMDDEEYGTGFFNTGVVQKWK